MSNKKAGVAIEEIVGLFIYTLAFVIISTIIILGFYGCNINNSQKTQEEFKVLKSGISTISNLNFFLNLPVIEDKKVMDLIVESYLNNDYNEFDTKTKEFFSEDEFCWRLVILDADDSNLNQLYNCEDYGEIITQNSVTMPIVDRDKELITVLLQIRERPKNDE